MLEEFLQSVWKTDGVVCISFLKGKMWEDRFFDYPTQKQEILETISSKKVDHDCYFVPSILKGHSRKKNSFKESSVVWVDLDGSPLDLIPIEPSFLVETSKDHYHAYWSLENPAHMQELESANKALATACSADMSGWDATQLLRLPDTFSFKRSEPVRLLKTDGITYSLDSLPKWRALNLNLWASLV